MLWTHALWLAIPMLAAPSEWVPMRWHSDDPKSLSLLTGTPVNCLLLETPEWTSDFIRAAKAQHIALIGLPQSDGDVKRAKATGFDAVLFEGKYDPSVVAHSRIAGLFVIELPQRQRIRLDAHDPILGTSQALWPGVEIEHGGKTVLGPTSSPWINTNGGFLRFVRAASSGVIWLGVRPPPRHVYPVERYAQAIGDAALVGARWIVALDQDLDQRLMKMEPEARKTWTTIAGYVDYFEQHPEWRSYRAYSRMAVIQDAANGGLLSGSLIDMLSSQRSCIRVLPPGKLTPDSLRNTSVLLDVDPEALSEGQRAAVDAFVNAGGTVINPPAKWRFPESSDDQILLERRQADKLQSLWEVTYNATVRKNFGARTFNTMGILTSVLAAPEGKSVLVHMLNFLDFPGEDITIHVLGKWKHATLYRLGAPPRELPVFDAPEGTGVEIDKVQLLATLKLDE